MFIMATYRFRALYPAFNPIRTEKLVSDAHEIYDRYISEESPTMINISADVRESMRPMYPF